MRITFDIWHEHLVVTVKTEKKDQWDNSSLPDTDEFSLKTGIPDKNFNYIQYGRIANRYVFVVKTPGSCINIYKCDYPLSICDSSGDCYTCGRMIRKIARLKRGFRRLSRQGKLGKKHKEVA